MTNLTNFIDSAKAPKTKNRVHHPLSILINYLSGNYRDNPKVHNLVPQYFVFLLAGIGLAITAAFISYETYLDLVKHETVAIIASGTIAIVVYFSCNYIAGIVSEAWTRKETKVKKDLKVRTFLKVAAGIALIVWGTWSAWDLRMNLEGSQRLGTSFGGEIQTVNIQDIKSNYNADLEQVRAEKEHLKNNRVNGFNWFDNTTNTYQLNKSGKAEMKRLNTLESDYMELLKDEKTSSQTVANDANLKRQSVIEFGKKSMTMVAKFIYVIMLIGAIAQSVFSQLICYFIDTNISEIYVAKEEAEKESSSQSDATQPPKPQSVADKKANEAAKVEYKSRNFTKKDAVKGKQSQQAKKVARAKRVRLLKSRSKTNSEIAKILNISIDTVRRDLRTATN